MKKNLFLLSIVILITCLPLVFLKDSEFPGADTLAKEAILKANESYQPWFNSIWSPPSGEIESMLFVLQGAIGAGLVGYCFGYMAAKNKKSVSDSNNLALDS